MVYEPTRFKIGIMLYFRARESQRGDQADMACYRLVVPRRAIRAGAAGDKDSKNSGELLLRFVYCLEIRDLDAFMDAILWRQCNRRSQPGVKPNRHRKSRPFLRGELRRRLRSRLRRVNRMRAHWCLRSS